MGILTERHTKAEIKLPASRNVWEIWDKKKIRERKRGLGLVVFLHFSGFQVRAVQKIKTIYLTHKVERRKCR